MPIVYFILAVCSFCLIYFKIHKDVLHPVAILTSVWFFTAAISSFQWGVYQHSWSLLTHFMIIMAGIGCFFAGFFVATHKECEGNEKVCINKKYRIITRILFILLLFMVIAIFYKNGMNLAFFHNMRGGDLKTEVSNKLEGITSFESYVINLLPFCAIFSFFELIYGERRERHIVYNVFVIGSVLFYCLRVIFSRGTLLYLLLGGIYIYNSKKKLSIKLLLFILLGVIILLGILMTIRVQAESMVFNGVKHISSPILTSAYNYIAYSFENFNVIVEKGSRYHIFANVFQSIYKLLGVYREDQIIANDIAGVFNSLTWLSPFYDDLGVFGTVFYPVVIGGVLAFFYNKSAKDKYYILILAVLQKAVFIPFFGNYFITTLSIVFPYIVTGIICFVSKRVKITIPKFKWG